jgi:hypothetical protein
VKRVLSIAAVAGLAVASIAMAEWKPAEGPLSTRWTNKVTPDNALPEYPRPQMARADWQNLNGLWDYAVVAKGADRPKQFDGQILIPFAVESALSGVMKKVTPDQAVWYRRTFSVPEAWSERRVLLNFGGVDWETTVWLNGRKLGEHRGGYDPFSFDVADALRSGNNELVLRVWDPTDEGYQPRGKQVLKPGGIWYTPTTGIWQTVWLEPVPETYVRSIRIVPDVDASAVKVTVDADGGQLELTAMADGKEVGTARGAAGQKLVLKLDDVRTWSPDDPFLYDLKIKLTADGKTDELSSYFGMRKIEVRRDNLGINRLFLNGKPLFQHGPLDQGFWPDGLYTAPTDEALRYDIEVTKKLGMNMARKHVKVEPDRWYYWCDKLGLLVWQDMPSGNNKGPEGQANFCRELKAVVEAFSNHPSIVMWVPFNEGWGQHDTEQIVASIKQWDPTRLVNNASGWADRKVGDVHDIHSYPGPGTSPVEEDRAVVLGEFGGLGLPISGHTWQQEKNWGYRSFENRKALNDGYVALLSKLRPLIGCGLAAAVYTQTSDVEVEVNGLMTYDRAIIKISDPVPIDELLWKPLMPRLDRPVKVDGSLSDWGEPAIRLRGPAKGWKGPEDLSVNLHWGSDGEALSVAAEVTDDRHANSQQGDLIWNGDALQMGLLTEEKIHWNIGLARTKQGVVFHQWSGKGDTLHKTAEYIAVRDDDAKTTRYELRLPLNTLEIKTGARFSFNVVVFDDDDGNGQRYWLELAPGLAGQIHDVTLYPVVCQ